MTTPALDERLNRLRNPKTGRFVRNDHVAHRRRRIALWMWSVVIVLLGPAVGFWAGLHVHHWGDLGSLWHG